MHMNVMDDVRSNNEALLLEMSMLPMIFSLRLWQVPHILKLSP